MANDVGLYNRTSNLTGLVDSQINFTNTVRACSGVTLSSNVFGFSTGQYLVLSNFDMDRVSGSTARAWVDWRSYDSGALNRHPGSLSLFKPEMGVSDVTYARGSSSGPGLMVVNDPVEVVPWVTLYGAGGGGSVTVNYLYSWVCVIKLDAPLVSCGIYTRSADQTNVDTVGEQVVWNNTAQACSGVSLSSGEFTFTADGLYVALATPCPLRSSGSGTTLTTQWTTDASGAGTTAFTDAVAFRSVTADATAPMPANTGAIAIVSRSGSNVTIGTSVLTVSATTVFTVRSLDSSVIILRLT